MSQGDKREIILDAALRRFMHFGVDKTTMNEIADDLSISKASLYYYYPDKLSLYAAILQRIVSAEEANTKDLVREKDAATAIFRYLENRTEFIIKYYNILEYLRTLRSDVPKELEAIFAAARVRELNVVIAILEKFRSILKAESRDVRRIAELFFDCLEGLRFSILQRQANFFPDKKQFTLLLKREKEFASIFLKGLS